MVLQNYQKFILLLFSVGFKCPRKIHLNIQCHAQSTFSNGPIIDLFLPVRDVIGHDKIELIDFVVNFLAHLVIN